MSSFNIIRAIILLTLLMVSFSTFSYIITKITLFQTKKRAKSLVLSIGPIIHLNMCFYVLLLCIYVCWWRCSLYAILFCIWMLNTVWNLSILNFSNSAVFIAYSYIEGVFSHNLQMFSCTQQCKILCYFSNQPVFYSNKKANTLRIFVCQRFIIIMILLSVYPTLLGWQGKSTNRANDRSIIIFTINKGRLGKRLDFGQINVASSNSLSVWK